MTRLAAKLLSRAGLAMLILCVGCRFIISTESAMIVDDLAIIASVSLTVVAMMYLRLTPHDTLDRARIAKNAQLARAKGSTPPPGAKACSARR